MKINQLKMLVEKNYIEILGILIIISLILLIINVISQFRISGIRKKYNKLVENVEGENLEDLILGLQSSLEKSSYDIEDLKREARELDEKLAYPIQKVKYLRYDAFEDLGSQQSYSLALLDRNNNGLILTSIFSRDYTASYLKPIEAGKSIYNLSKEEESVLNDALNI